MRQGHCHRHGVDYGPCTCTLGKIPRLIEPILLYLLAAGEAEYGYELTDRAASLAMTDAGVDPGGVYRVLRHLEEQGCVVSEWSQGERGPSRRLYRVTDDGLRQLRDWSVVLGRSGAAMVDLSRKCEALPQRAAEGPPAANRPSSRTRR